MKSSKAIKTPVHFDQEAERMIRQMLKDDKIEESTKESKFCAHRFFIQKPNGRGLRLVTDYRDVNQLIETPEWPFQSTDKILE